MKITFMHEGAIQEFTPPDYATTVVIKTRPSGISIDYESSTVEAVKEFFDAPLVNAIRKKAPALIPAGKVDHHLSVKERHEVVRAWSTERPVPTYEALGKRFGVHRTTIGDIIEKSLQKPAKGGKKATKKKIGNQGWSTTPTSQEKKDQILQLVANGMPVREVAELSGINVTTVKRIIKSGGAQPKDKWSRRRGSTHLTPFQEEEIVRLIDEGAIAKQAIADKFHVHISTVSRLLARVRGNNFQNSLDQPVAEV